MSWDRPVYQYSHPKVGSLIRFSKTLYQRGKEKISTSPKTNNSIRTVSMSDAIMEEVQAYINKIYGIQPQDRVFGFTDMPLRKNMAKYSEKAGIPRIRIHDIRHSHVSLLINMGFTPQLIAERIGDTVQMVNSVYGHLYPNKHEEVADKLNPLIVPK